MHPYAYALNSPTSYVDPSGNVPILIPLLVVALIGINTGTGYYEAEARRYEMGLSQDQAPSSLALGVSDATGMTSVFRGVTGGDPYSGQQLGTGRRWFEGTVGALGLIGTGAAGAQLLRAGGTIAQAGFSGYQAAGGGLRGALGGSRAAGAELGEAMAAEWVGTWGQVASDLRATGSAVRHPIQTCRQIVQTVGDVLVDAGTGRNVVHQGLRNLAARAIRQHRAWNRRYSWNAPPGGHWSQGVSHQMRLQLGLVGRPEQLHHWLIPQRVRWIPNYIKNRMWNIKVTANRAAHARIDAAFSASNVTPYPLAIRPWMAMPNWARAGTVGTGVGLGYLGAEAMSSDDDSEAADLVEPEPGEVPID
jgi:hypothetical protein